MFGLYNRLSFSVGRIYFSYSAVIQKCEYFSMREDEGV